MRKVILIVTLCAVLAFAAAYAAYGQSREYIDKLKQAEEHIALLEKINEAVKSIEKDLKPESKMRIFDITDLEMSLIDYAPPSPFVHDVESGFGRSEFTEEESFEEPFGPEEIIEVIRARTGEENWPEEAGGFGTLEHHRGKLIVINTPEILQQVESIIEEMRSNSPALISSTVHLFALDEKYLEQIRKKGSSVITPQAIKKLIEDAEKGTEVELLRTGYLTSYSSQAAYLYAGTIHTYQGDTDTSGAGGLTPVVVFDPIINIFREGFIIGLRAQYNRTTGDVNMVAMVSLSKLTAIEEHTGMGGGLGKEAPPEKCRVETPKVDLQIVSGSSDAPEGYGLLVGGSRMKTTQTEQKSFVVLIVPEVQK